MAMEAVSSLDVLIRKPEDRRWIAVPILDWLLCINRKELRDDNGVLILAEDIIHFRHYATSAGW